MLVLSRKKDETIVVDNAICVTVLEVRGNRVRLGIEAPQSVPIQRSEIRPFSKPRELDADRDATGAGSVELVLAH